VVEFKKICEDEGISYYSDKIAILTRHKIYDNADIDGLWKTSVTEWLAKATYYWHRASKKEAYRLCEKALYEMTIGAAEELSQDEIKAMIESMEEYSIWKSKVVSLLTLLPSEDLDVKGWCNNLKMRLSELTQCGEISLRSDLKIDEIIKTKAWIKKKGKKRDESFLDKSLYEYFEKKSKQDVTISSIHGVKGETYEAVLLKIKSTGGPTLTPDKLFKGELDDEIMRIAYVAMTRPRKILAIAVPYSEDYDLTRFPENLWDYRIV